MVQSRRVPKQNKSMRYINKHWETLAIIAIYGMVIYAFLQLNSRSDGALQSVSVQSQ